MPSRPKPGFSTVIVSFSLGCAAATPAVAAVIIPEKGGFSGFVNLGLGYAEVESNLMAQSGFGIVDLGKERIDNLLDSPDSESSALPMANFELSYTFAESRTQIYVGNLLEDFLRFDMNTVLGVRQGIGSAGILGANLRRTSVVTEVWEDPYVTGTKRQETDREGAGFQLFWQQLFGTGLELEYTAMEIDIDDERSGAALELPGAERKLLDRNGDRYRFNVRYELSLDSKRHILTPGVGYVDNDRDGDAVSYDGISVDLNYIYAPNQRWAHVINLAYADFDFEASHPVYGVKDSSEVLGGGITTFYREPLGWKQWSANATLAWYQDDRKIDFHDTSVWLVSVGMLRRF